MIPALLIGALCCLAALVMTRPLWSGSLTPEFVQGEPDHDTRTELEQQLRDLDEDLAAGKLLETDHQRLRAPVERALSASMAEPVRPTSGVPAPHLAGRARPQQRAHRVSRRILRWGSVLVIGAVAVAGVTLALRDEVTPRESAAAVGEAEGGAGTVPAADPATAATPAQPTAAQLADVDAAVSQVRKRPKDVAAHLALAAAYEAAGQRQLSTIEYLAVTQLAPANAQANVALALAAYEQGKIEQSRDIIARVLKTHPRHPEALFARGVIELMGLNHPRKAKSALEDYLVAAPFGSHRADVESMIEVIDRKTAP